MKDLDHISALPGVGRLFVGLFTTLMLLVCLWAIWIYAVEKGPLHPDNLPVYMQSEDIGSGVVTSEAATPDEPRDSDTRLRKNLGLAHTHVNGQTLLFFALGAVFLFTSVQAKTKRYVLLAFGATVLIHAVGLSGAGFHWVFDDILAVSGVVMLVLIAFMCFRIYVDLARKKA
ncbi:MAG: hypothetical protein KKA42_07430 [candidate division Zixibacteria bacterium]|nr:hypothetical protein [candidate division Zixibacteria bacterium]